MRWSCGTKSLKTVNTSYSMGLSNLINGLSCWYTKTAYQSGWLSTKRKNLQMTWLRLRWNMDYQCQGGKFNMEYNVLVGASTKMLTSMVKINIAAGWKPIGGVGVAMDNYGNKTFAQAVIKGE